VTEAPPARCPHFEFAHLAPVECREHAAAAQVAIDLVAGGPLADDVAALEGHGAERGRCRFAVAPGDDVDIAAVAVDDLAAVAPAGTPADTGRFQHDHPPAALGQLQRGRKPGK